MKAPSKKLDDDPIIILDGVSLQALASVKLLGFHIDKHLNYSTHIKETVLKCKGLLGVMKRSSCVIPQEMLKLFYTAIVRTHLEYCAAVFCQAAPTHLTKLDVIQKMASRIIMGASSQAHSAPLQEHLGLEPLEVRRKAHVIDIVKKCLLQTYHPAVAGMIQVAQTGSILKPTARTIARKRSFSYAAAEIFNNSLPIIPV